MSLAVSVTSAASRENSVALPLLLAKFSGTFAILAKFCGTFAMLCEIRWQCDFRDI